ncbi:MAG: S1 RNA-binding domain-containing protein [Chitinivibrionales bacterium]|nr:S1 RNA-binding domain-containing protein [Chitinivibrionales bacterium]
MIQFAKHISDKWGISDELSKEICVSFSRNDSPFYLSDYNFVIAAELDLLQLREIYGFLNEIAALSSKRTRVLNALKKANKLTPALEDRINLTPYSYELDDILAPYRSNPRSRGQQALRKGLGELADIFELQEEETTPLEELAAPYVGKHPSLKTVDDVISSTKDILVERFSTDETVRAMVRDFGYEQGQFEIIPKKKKDPRFASYAGKFIDPHSLTAEELLAIMVAADNKEIRLKLVLQLFRITELLKAHFIINPDFVGFDMLCEAIDECWVRLLQPLVEKDVMGRLQSEAENKIAQEISRDLENRDEEPKHNPVLAISIDENLHAGLVALDIKGRLMGAAGIKINKDNKSGFVNRLKQFITRYRIAAILLPETESSKQLESSIAGTIEHAAPNCQLIRLEKEQTDLAKSEWVMNEFADLDDTMRRALANALEYLQPLDLISEISGRYFQLHPKQHLLSEDRITEIVRYRTTVEKLKDGLEISSLSPGLLSTLYPLPESVLNELTKPSIKTSIAQKLDIANIKGLTGDAFRNIAGYIIIPTAPELLDRTLVHPDYFDWLMDISQELNCTTDALINDPNILRTYDIEDYVKKLYIEKKLMHQLSAGKKYIAKPAMAKKRRKKLTEIKEDTIVSGVVTNVAPFGAFVDINAVCDGLIHISQMADGYVESTEQVVSVNDRVNVRVVKVDVKKRRISLSMKGLGNMAPKVSPSKGQLSNLADHFKNR